MATGSDPGSERQGIFRPEALEHRARRRGQGDVIRVAPRWTTTAFYVLVGLFAIALVVSMSIEVDRFASGTAVTDGQGRVVVLLPAALAADVAPGQAVELEGTRAEVVSWDDAVLYPAEVEARFGAAVAVPSVAVVTSAPASSERPGTARVLIEREPVIVALVPGLKALLGGDDA